MVKERIPPEMIIGIVAKTPETKTALVSYLKEGGLVQNGAIFGRPIDNFIHVGNTITPNMLRSH